MTRVNLIPTARRRTTRKPRFSVPAGRPGTELIVAVLALILLFGSIAVFIVERRNLSEAQGAVVEAEADSARLHDAVDRVERIQRAQTRLGERIEVLEGVVDRRLYSLRLMESLSRSLPAYVWLERVDRQDLEPEQIRIAGASFANAAITDFMRGLEASPELRDVRLVEVSRSRRDSVDIQQFTLVAGEQGRRTPKTSPDSTEGDPSEIEPAERSAESEEK